MASRNGNQSDASLDTSALLRQIVLPLFLGVALIYLAFLKPGIWGFDGNDMLHMSESLILKGNFTLPSGAGGILGPDGQYYSIRYPLLPIVATPFVGVGLLLGDWLNLPPHYTAAVCALVLPILLTALTGVMIFLLTLRLGGDRTGAYLAALSFAFGTTALVYAREFFAEPLLSLLTVCSLYLALGKTVKAHAGASILAGLAIVAKPAGIVIGPVLSLYFLVKRFPLRTVIGPFLGTCMGVMLYLMYNYIRFGNILSSGQDTSRLNANGFLERFFGLILSPGAGGGLWWYCPPTILAVWGVWKLLKTKPPEALAISGIFVGYWVLHSFWRFGGWNWGPRFLIPTLPGLLALIGLLNKRQRKWLIGLTVIGFLVNAPTLVSFYQRYYAEASDSGQLLQALALWGNPADAPIFNGWGVAYRQLSEAFSTNVSEVLSMVGAPPDPSEIASAELARIVAVWWWVLPAAGIPVWIGAVLAVLLVGSGLWLLSRGWRFVKDSDSVQDKPI